MAGLTASSVSEPFELDLGLALVALASGCLIPLHMLALVGLITGANIVTPGPVVAVCLAGMCVSLFALKHSGVLAGAFRFRGMEPLPRAIGIMLGITGIFYLLLFADTFWTFPSGYDAIAYHANVALKWLQTGSLRVNPAWGWQYSLPSNAELQALIAISAGAPRLIAAGNLFASLLLGVSTSLIALKLTGRRAAALLSGIAAVTIPIVMYQAVQLYVDLFGTAFLIAGIALLVWRDARPAVCIFLAGYSAGVAIGAKPVFWIYGFLFTAAALCAIARDRRRSVRFIMLLVCGLVLSCGFWFLRSALATGNPVYPMRVAIAGHQILPGYDRTDITSPDYGIPHFADALIQPWVERVEAGELPVGSERGTGPLVAAIALPGVFFLLIRAARGRAGPLEVSLLCGAAAGFLVWNLALLRVVRFALPLVVLCCALAAPMIDALFRQAPRIPVILFAAGVVMNGCFCLAEPAQRAVFRISHGDFSRATFYGYPPVVDRLPPASRVLDLTHNHRASFLLAGRRLSNYVLPAGAPQGPDYIVKDGPRDAEDAAALARGFRLIYDGVPPYIYEKTAKTWRVYQSPAHNGS